MAITNTYKVNGGAAQAIVGGSVDIDMSTTTGVKAGCKEYPIPLLNKITVTSADGALTKTRTIYAGYRVVQQMLGSLIPAGNYNLNTPKLNTIISNGKFGIFEPGHYNSATGTWSVYGLSATEINSILNIGTGIKICVKIEYTKSNSSLATAYVPISGATGGFSERENMDVPYWTAIGGSSLSSTEAVEYRNVDSASRRSWFESVLTSSILDINLSSIITTPDTTRNIGITLMAYVGSTPTANNAFLIRPMNSSYQTSVTVPFETYNPEINIYNKDMSFSQDTYTDGYGSVADYDTGSSNDTTITVEITAP